MTWNSGKGLAIKGFQLWTLLYSIANHFARIEAFPIRLPMADAGPGDVGSDR